MPTQRVSNTADGSQANNGSGNPLITGDGRFVVFETAADNLVSPDTNGSRTSIVRKNLETGELTLVNVSPAGAQPDLHSVLRSVSENGRFVAFETESANLVPGEPGGLFVKDLETGVLTRIGDGSVGLLTADGAQIAFNSGRTVDVFVQTIATGALFRVSSASDGTRGNGYSGVTTISADGRYVGFWSEASNLVAGDTNGRSDYFVKDTVTGTTTRVNADDEHILIPSGITLSADGRFAVYGLDDPRDPWDSPVLRKDLVTGEVRAVNVNAAGAPADDTLSGFTLSADGRYVGFISRAGNLVFGDTNGFIRTDNFVFGDARGGYDAFVKDMDTGEVERISLTTSGGESSGNSWAASLSLDGRLVAFASDAANLVAGDTNRSRDVFVGDGEGTRAPILGDAGDDSLAGTAGPETISGRAGDDTLDARGGDDLLIGDDGDDRLSGGSDADSLFGAAGTDTLDGDDGDDWLEGGDGSDVLSGGAGDDLLLDESGANTLDGGLGDDTVLGGSGSDSLIGGLDDDIIDFRGASTAADTLDGGAGDDRVFASDGDDRVSGGDGFDVLSAGGGDDSIDGGDHRDTITGAAGADTMRGGNHADTYRFLSREDSLPWARDAIAGFHGAGAPGGDVINLSAIDANSWTWGDEPFAFIGTAPVFTAMGQIRLVDIGDSTLLLGNLNTGMSSAEFAVSILDGDAATAADYTADDFIL